MTITEPSAWRWERQGLFPKRLRLGPNRIGWRESAIRDWLDSRPCGTEIG